MRTGEMPPTFTTSKVFGGRQDGKALMPFPEGNHLVGASGWPIVLDELAEPIPVGTQSGDQRYVQKIIKDPDGQYLLIYVWEPSLMAWLFATGAIS